MVHIYICKTVANLYFLKILIKMFRYTGILTISVHTSLSKED